MVSDDSFNMISLFGVDIDQWSGRHEIEQALKVLSEDEIERGSRYQFEHLKERFLWGRFFLRQVLSQLTGIGASEIRFEIGTNGKPSLKNVLSTQSNFSFSRSGHFAVCCFTTGVGVGIDVESLTEVEDLPTMARAIFSDDRYAHWDRLPEAKKQIAFHRSWTRKEAVAKIDGRGVSVDITGVDVPFECFGHSESHHIQLSQAVAGQVQLPPISAVVSDWCPFDEVTASVAFEADLPNGYEVAFHDRVDDNKSNFLDVNLPIVSVQRQFSLVQKPDFD